MASRQFESNDRSDKLRDELSAEPAIPLAGVVRSTIGEQSLGLVRRLGWPALVVLAVILANLPALIGLVDVSPLGTVGATASHLSPGFFDGVWYTDPQIGYTAQSLGHLAAMDWLHGIIPWWNPFEGAGAPFAAEMQAAVFFPPTLLLALSNGQLYFHMLLEAAGGIGMWLLLRELGMRRPIATLGGVLFALNGTFVWFWHAPANPVALLPFELLGVERIFRRSARDNTGWVILAFSFALSFYAGFPETTYLDGLFVAVWVLLRLVVGPGIGRVKFLGKVVLGAVAGALVAAPLELAFDGYLKYADVGQHSGALANVHATFNAVEALGFPYLYGTLLAAPHGHGALAIRGWQMFGGFVTASVIVLAVLGLLAARRAWLLRIALAVGSCLVVLWTFGVEPVARILARVIPLTDRVWVSRYSEPTFELALVVLACFGVEAIASSRRRTSIMALFAGAATLGGLAVVFHKAHPTLLSVTSVSSAHASDATTMVLWAVSFVLAITVLAVVSGLGDLFSRRRAPDDAPAHARRRMPRLGTIAAAAAGSLVACDVLAMAALPPLSAPRSETIDLGPAHFLAAHLGNGRFFSYGVYHPDYGSYFGLAQLDTNDTPVPKSWANYVVAHLDSNTRAIYFGSRPRSLTHGPTPMQALVGNLGAYEALDVRYVVLAASNHAFGNPASGPLKDGVRLVYEDKLAAIYQLPHPRGFFYTVGGSCSLRPDGNASVTATCAHATTLIRSETYLPGWTATLDNHPAAVTEAGGLVQAVSLPKGTSTVTYSYTPKHATLGLGLFVLGMLVTVGAPVGARLRRRRRSTSPTPAEQPDARAGAAPEV